MKNHPFVSFLLFAIGFYQLMRSGVTYSNEIPKDWVALETTLSDQGLDCVKEDVKGQIIRWQVALTTKILVPTHVSIDVLKKPLTRLKTVQGQLIFEPDSNRIIVTDTPGTIAEMERVLAELDSDTETRVFKIEYADIAHVAEKLEVLLDPRREDLIVDEKHKLIIITDTVDRLDRAEAIIENMESGLDFQVVPLRRKPERQLKGIIKLQIKDLGRAAIGVPLIVRGVRSEHPRVFITPESLPELRERARGDRKEIFDAIEGRLRERWYRDNMKRVDWSTRNGLEAWGLLALLTEDPYYLDAIDEQFKVVAADPPRNQYLTPSYLRALSLVYDWTYSLATPEQRRGRADVLCTLADYCRTIWRHSDYNNHMVAERMVVLFPGVVLFGDGLRPEKSNSYLEEGKSLWLNHAIPAANQMAGEEGGHAEGFSYAGWGYAPHIAFTAELYRTAFGKDFFAELPFLREYASWNVHCTRPQDGALVRSEDCRSGYTWNQGNEGTYMPLLAARYQDGLAQWILSKIPRRYPQLRWAELLWYEPSIPVARPESLPLSRHFTGLGWVVTRSGWGPDDTMALFQCGDFYAGHQHVDNNSFVIHRGGALAIDSGVYDESPHRANYFCRSVAHNTITVYDPEEVFSNRTWSAQGTGGSNDGGQLRGVAATRFGQVTPGSQHDVGDIVAYVTGDSFTYVCGDATRAYSLRKLSLFTRQFVHIRPDLFIVFDRVTSTRPDFSKRWLLHSLDEPRVNEKNVTIQYGRGKLLCRTLLPEDVTITKVGGRGREFFVGGRNYPPQKSDPEAGAWRIEVSPVREKTEDIFLHVMLAGGRDLERMVPVSVEQTEEQVEVVCSLPEGEVQCTFSTVGEPGGSLRVVRGGRIEEANFSQRSVRNWKSR